MGKAHLQKQTKINLMGIGWMTKYPVKALIMLPMEIFIQDNGEKIEETARGFRLRLTVTSMKEPGKMIKKKVSENTSL